MVLGKNDKILFGKYKGKTISEIAEENPGYIVWLDENVKTISIDQKIVADCEEISDEENDYAWMGNEFDWGDRD